MDCNIYGSCRFFIFLALSFAFTLDFANCLGYADEPHYNNTELDFNFPVLFINSLPNHNPNYNLLTSPPAIRFSFSSAAYGALGETQDDLTRLFYGNSYFKIHESFRELEKIVTKWDYRIFLNKDMGITPCFDHLIEGHKHLIDYSNKSKSAAIINDWVSEQMNRSFDRITITLDKFHNERNTFLTFVHVNYLRATWEKPFVKIIKNRHHYSRSPDLLGDMMYQENTFLYGGLDELDAIAVELPLTDGTRMIIVQPEVYSSNFQDLKHKLLKFDLRTLNTRLKPTRISLYMPLLHNIKMDRSMKPTLENLGVKVPFQQSYADFRLFHQCGDETYIKMFNQRSRITANKHELILGSATGVQFSYPDDDVDDLPENVVIPHIQKIPTTQQNGSIPQVMLDYPFFYAVIKQEQFLWIGTLYKPNNKDIKYNPMEVF